jgi:hypothetical protein
MKTFTAKEFSRCPAKVYEAAREDGLAEITHDRFGGKFIMEYNVGLLTAMNEKELSPVIMRTFSDLEEFNKGFIDITELRRRENKKAPD